MKGIIAASLFAFSVFFRISPALALVPASAQSNSVIPDPCTGPRGDGTFTPQELLSLFTLETVPADDGHDVHYGAMLGCKNGNPLIITLILDPAQSEIFFSVENEEAYGFRPKVGVDSSKSTHMFLEAGLPKLEKEIVVNDHGKTREVQLRLDAFSTVMLMSALKGPWNDAASIKNQTRIAARRFIALVRVIKRTHGKEPIILKGLVMTSLFSQEVRLVTHSSVLVKPIIGKPHQVFVGKELIWENMQ